MMIRSSTGNQEAVRDGLTVLTLYGPHPHPSPSQSPDSPAARCLASIWRATDGLGIDAHVETLPIVLPSDADPATPERGRT